MLPALKKYYLFIVIFLALAIPFALAARTVLTGSFPFWFDNGRDLLLAWGNLNKPTLIGPPSGIPGIFYGPYWIWLLSLALVISKNPALVDFLVATLPYFIIFPLILWQFRKLVGKPAIVILWLLFILSSGNQYATQLWNPHLAPLIFLGLVYLLLFTDRSHLTPRTRLKVLATGLTAGLLLNFHISFGISIFLGTIIFFMTELVAELASRKSPIKQILLRNLLTFVLFGVGVLITFIPTIWFEFRHGFNESHAVIQTFLRYGDVIKLKALTKKEILRLFFRQLPILLHLPYKIGYALEIILGGFIALLSVSRRLKLSAVDKRLIMLLCSLSAGVLCIYLSAKNPVWSYHFIGTEIIFLLFIGWVLKKIPVLIFPASLLVIFLVVSNLITFYNAFALPMHTAPDLFTKEEIVSLIGTDAAGNPYTVFTYNPAIYTYEFTYLYKWRADKDVPYDPGLISMGDPVIYLSIPPGAEPALEEDFIHFRSPDAHYTTAQTWNLSDGSTVMKRVRSK